MVIYGREKLRKKETPGYPRHQKMFLFSVLTFFVVNGVCHSMLAPYTTVPPADSGLLHRIEILEQDNALLRQQVYGLMNNVQQLQTQYETLTDKEQSIGFFAYLGKDLVNPASGITVPFDEVVTNIGNAYDGVHGTFRAPINGTYYFSLVGSSPSQSDASHILHLFIVQGGKKLTYCFLDHSVNQWTHCNVNALVHLKEGDMVWVKVDGVSTTHEHVLAGHRLADDAAHSHFMGFLVNSD